MSLCSRTTAARRILVTAIAGVTAALTLMVNDGAGRVPGASFLATAQARIGRPLTPMSYAGVARRTARRSYGYGAAAVGAGAVAAGAYAYGAYGAAPVAGAGCVQVVNAYGQVYWQCP
jgi:hypothetical protein